MGQMDAAVLGNPSETRSLVEAIAREKGLDIEKVILGLEAAIEKVARMQYGQDMLIKAHIDRKTYAVTIARHTEVATDVLDEAKQIRLADAQKIQPGIQVGEFIVEPLPMISNTRTASNVSKGVINQQIRRFEREREFVEFKDRIGDIIHGVVKRVDFGNAVIDLGGRAEGFLRRDEIIPRETLRQGDRVRAYIFDVREEPYGPQILLSRTHPQFMAKLFAQEVPEIYEGTIEIKAVARDPGSRAKIAVYSKEKSIDPVGACVGLRGSRVQAVVGELQGEKIDIIPYSEDPAALVVNGLSPATVTKVVVDEDAHRIEVVVPDEQLSLAIGRRGQNVRLASMLIGWNIDVLTEEEESARRSDEFKRRTQRFITALDVEEVIAQLLVAEAFLTLDDVAYVPVEQLAKIEGFDADVAAELQRRAVSFIEAEKAERAKRQAELGMTDDLIQFNRLSQEQIMQLAEKGVLTLDDLADLAADELMEMLPEANFKKDRAEQIIMAARQHWFKDEAAPAESTETARATATTA